MALDLNMAAVMTVASRSQSTDELKALMFGIIDEELERIKAISALGSSKCVVYEHCDIPEMPEDLLVIVRYEADAEPLIRCYRGGYPHSNDSGLTVSFLVNEETVRTRRVMGGHTPAGYSVGIIWAKNPVELSTRIQTQTNGTKIPIHWDVPPTERAISLN